MERIKNKMEIITNDGKIIATDESGNLIFAGSLSGWIYDSSPGKCQGLTQANNLKELKGMCHNQATIRYFKIYMNNLSGYQRLK